jgi:hypothetical protein
MLSTPEDSCDDPVDMEVDPLLAALPPADDPAKKSPLLDRPEPDESIKEPPRSPAPEVRATELPTLSSPEYKCNELPLEPDISEMPPEPPAAESPVRISTAPALVEEATVPTLIDPLSCPTDDPPSMTTEPAVVAPDPP